MPNVAVAQNFTNKPETTLTLASETTEGEPIELALAFDIPDGDTFVIRNRMPGGEHHTYLVREPMIVRQLHNAIQIMLKTAIYAREVHGVKAGEAS